MTIRAITFDFWNTLVQANDAQATWRIESWKRLLGEADHEVDEALIRAAFRDEWNLHDTLWKQGVIYSGRDAALGAADRIGVGAERAQLRETLVHAFITEGENAEFTLCPGALETIPQLASLGIRLGIVCDVGFTPSTGLRRLLDRHGLLQHFTGWSFSDEVGTYKPDPAIFRHALGYLDVEPAEAAHVGDIRRTDIAGALAMGMTAVRYRAVADDTSDDHPEGHTVIDHHDELAAVLQLT